MSPKSTQKDDELIDNMLQVREEKSKSIEAMLETKYREFHSSFSATEINLTGLGLAIKASKKNRSRISSIESNNNSLAKKFSSVSSNGGEKLDLSEIFSTAEANQKSCSRKNRHSLQTTPLVEHDVRKDTKMKKKKRQTINTSTLMRKQRQGADELSTNAKTVLQTPDPMTHTTDSRKARRGKSHDSAIVRNRLRNRSSRKFQQPRSLSPMVSSRSRARYQRNMDMSNKQQHTIIGNDFDESKSAFFIQDTLNLIKEMKESISDHDDSTEISFTDSIKVLNELEHKSRTAIRATNIKKGIVGLTPSDMESTSQSCDVNARGLLASNENRNKEQREDLDIRRFLKNYKE